MTYIQRDKRANVKIRTRRGRLLTLSQYVALVQANDQPCRHGHFSCAAWDGGPCIDELLAEQEAREYKL
jgi:hypothetical protein